MAYHVALHGFLTQESIVVVEQDLDFTLGQKTEFQKAIDERPLSIIVAPYLLYPKSSGLLYPVWAHRVITERAPLGRYSAKWIDTKDEFCDLFGLGFTYIPQWVWLLFGDRALTYQRDLDTRFSEFCYDQEIRARVNWKTVIQHLHY